MPAVAATFRRPPVNLTLDESQVTQAKTHTNYPSATMEVLVTEFEPPQQQAQHSRQILAEACVTDWNAVNAKVGSFADERVHL